MFWIKLSRKRILYSSEKNTCDKKSCSGDYHLLSIVVNGPRQGAWDSACCWLSGGCGREVIESSNKGQGCSDLQGGIERGIRGEELSVQGAVGCLRLVGRVQLETLVSSERSPRIVTFCVLAGYTCVSLCGDRWKHSFSTTVVSSEGLCGNGGGVGHVANSVVIGSIESHASALNIGLINWASDKWIWSGVNAGDPGEIQVIFCRVLI